MATFVQTEAQIYIGGITSVANTNAIAIEYGCEEKDATEFNDTTRTFTGGLKTASVSQAGYLNLAQQARNVARWTSIGVNDTPLTIAPNDGTIADPAFFMQSLQTQFNPDLTLGEMAAFELTAMSRGDLVQGNIIFPQTSVTTTSTSTPQEFGAVSATQSAFAALHVLSSSGTSETLDVVVQSDTEVGFPSATNVLTFTQATDRTSEILSVGPAAITDTWWRISYTIGGTNTPTFSIVVAFGIQ